MFNFSRAGARGCITRVGALNIMNFGSLYSRISGVNVTPHNIIGLILSKLVSALGVSVGGKFSMRLNRFNYFHPNVGTGDRSGLRSMGTDAVCHHGVVFAPNFCFGSVLAHTDMRGVS